MFHLFSLQHPTICFDLENIQWNQPKVYNNHYENNTFIPGKIYENI